MHSCFDRIRCTHGQAYIRQPFICISKLGSATKTSAVFRVGPLEFTIRARRLGSGAQSMLALGYSCAQPADSGRANANTAWNVNTAHTLSLYAEPASPLDGAALEHVATNNLWVTGFADISTTYEDTTFCSWRNVLRNARIQQTNSFVVELKLQYEYVVFPLFDRPRPSTNVTIACKDGVTLYMNNEQLRFHDIDIECIRPSHVDDEGAPDTGGTVNVQGTGEKSPPASQEHENARASGEYSDKVVESGGQTHHPNRLKEGEAATTTFAHPPNNGSQVVGGGENQSLLIATRQPLTIETGYTSTNLLHFFHILFFDKKPPYYLNCKTRVLDIADVVENTVVQRRIAASMMSFTEYPEISSALLGDTYAVPVLTAFAKGNIATGSDDFMDTLRHLKILRYCHESLGVTLTQTLDALLDRQHTEATPINMMTTKSSRPKVPFFSEITIPPFALTCLILTKLFSS